LPRARLRLLQHSATAALAAAAAVCALPGRKSVARALYLAVALLLLRWRASPRGRTARAFAMLPALNFALLALDLLYQARRAYVVVACRSRSTSVGK
jgi:hypothetical protein